MNGNEGTIIVTGASGGLGGAIAARIASDPQFSTYTALYTGRDKQRMSSLTTALANAKAPHRHDVLALDLTKLENVRNVARDINARVATGKLPPIRTLILNAGFQDFGHQSFTDAGLDTVFATNYLGHWLLTLLLLQSMDREKGRVVVIGSQSHNPHDPRNARTGAFDDPKHKTIISDAASFEAIAEGTFSSAAEDPSWRGGFRRYGASKFLAIMMQHELQARLDRDDRLKNICVVGVDPGTLITAHTRLAPWFIRVVLFSIIYPVILYLVPNGPIRSVSRAAEDILWAGVGAVDESEPPRDRYFFGREPMPTCEESRDPEKRKLVWRETVKLAGLETGDTILADWQ